MTTFGMPTFAEDAASRPEDLATALMRYIDEGEALASRCRLEGFVYLGTVLLAALRRLHETAAHEFARTKGERSDGVTQGR